MDFDAPWQHALGPGGHYYTPFQESVSASCFRKLLSRCLSDA